MNDAELIRAIQGGDRDSLTALYQRYLSGIWRYFHAHLSWNRETAEDLVSETFLTAIRTLSNYDPERGTVYSWLIGIARNELRDYFRRSMQSESFLRASANNQGNADPATPDQDLVQVETQDAVVRTLDAMEDEERLVLEWKYLESLSVRTIAERLGRTEKAVESILYRARASFRSNYPRGQTNVK